MTPAEFVVVAATIVVGALFGHSILLLLHKKVRSIPSNAHFLGKELASNCHGNSVSLDTSFASEQKIQGQRKQTSSTSRGLITSLPARAMLPTEKAFSRADQEGALHRLLLKVQAENPRSTYLGAETFSTTNPSAHLFGWNRVPGRSTIQLGTIGHVVKHGMEPGLRVLLHPDDARLVISTGWATQTNPDRPSTRGISLAKEISVLLGGPRNDTELQEVTKIVLDAAVWHVAGLDREENV